MTSPSETTASAHGFVTRGAHWLSVVLIAYGYAKGLDDVEQLADPALFRSEVVFASCLGLLFVFRLFWTRTIGGATRLPEGAPNWERIASRTVHQGLYASIFAIVGSGLAIALAHASPHLGRPFVDAAIAAHEAALATLPILVLIHVAGALWRKLVRRDGVFESMVGRLPSGAKGERRAANPP